MPDFPQLPPIAAAPMSVVLVACDDEAHIEQVVGDWVSYLESLCRPYSLVLVDDGSTDRTAVLAEDLAKRHRRIRVLRHPAHQGFGAALRTALPAAENPLLCYCPCDPQFRPTDLKLLLDEIDHLDLVSGCRRSRPAPVWLRWLGILYRVKVRVFFGVHLEPRPVWPGWRGQLFYWLVRSLFGVRLVDVGSPFKLCRRSLFARIPIQSEGPFVHAEIVAKANFLGALMAEVPVAHHPSSPAGQLHEQDRQWWADFRRVFAHPDFGPAVLPEPNVT